MLIFSLIFYAWGEPKFVFIMVISIILNYIFGILIGSYGINILKKRLFLFFGIAFNLSLLIYFKYFNFIIDIINRFLFQFPDELQFSEIILPIGISFYTFQSLSYLIDVYYNSDLKQRNLINLGLYISSFPQLIAGPIVRYKDVQNQIRNRAHSIDLFISGLERFIIGLAKKVLIANTVGEIADLTFANNPSELSAYYLWLGIISFTIQIYFDFSGYSDMAIGLGRMFGFKFLENFNYPYISKSISEFWRRWHISLSSWFKDYLYIPLGGNRKGKLRTTFNLLIVFFITGIWHGANYNFVLWGLSHGILIFVEKIFNKFFNSNHTLLKTTFLRLYTLGALIISFVLFKSSPLFCINYIMGMFNINYALDLTDSFNKIHYYELLLSLDLRFYLVLIIGIFTTFPWWKKIKINKKSKFFFIIKWILLISIFFLSFINIADSSYNPFIYFRF